MDSSDDTHMTPDLPPRVSTPDLAGQGGPRSDEPRAEPGAANPAAARPRTARGRGKAPRPPAR
ncbi:hypothetical protein [Streptomyces sp. NPDC021224]|uniref:hypothetical protein n=1 Tax=unclassified Streptomyces TaxID=2593676 RepID=UPI0037AD2D2D